MLIMITNKAVFSIASIITSAGVLASVAAMPAYAATASTTTQQTRLAAIIARSDTEIAKRITDLNNLSTRIAAMKNVSAAEKTTLQNEIQTNVTGLTSLKATIDAGTDLTTVRTEEKTIATSFRVYDLVIPQGYIVAAADRVATIDGMMSSLAIKLETRITQAQGRGDAVASLESALSDFNAKVADSGTEAQNAQNGVASLAPDQGNATVAASNHAALLAARADIKTASQDLQAARADAKTIVQGLKGLKGSTATSTAQ